MRAAKGIAHWDKLLHATLFPIVVVDHKCAKACIVETGTTDQNKKRGSSGADVFGVTSVPYRQYKCFPFHWSNLACLAYLASLPDLMLSRTWFGGREVNLMTFFCKRA